MQLQSNDDDLTNGLADVETPAPHRERECRSESRSALYYFSLMHTHISDDRAKRERRRCLYYTHSALHRRKKERRAWTDGPHSQYYSVDSEAPCGRERTFSDRSVH